MSVRILDLGVATLFAFAAIVQFNDPDSIRWVAIYVVAGVMSALAASARRVPAAAFVVVGAAALLWAVFIMLGGPGASEYGDMFDAWEMKSVAVEEAREASGLLIVSTWMAVLMIRSARRARTVRG